VAPPPRPVASRPPPFYSTVQRCINVFTRRRHATSSPRCIASATILQYSCVLTYSPGGAPRHLLALQQFAERMIDDCSVVQRSFRHSCLSLAGFLANKSVHQLVRTYLVYEPIWVDFRLVFTARCYASAVLATALCLSVCLSICPSVTSRSSTKTAKRRIIQTTPRDTPGTLVFRCQRSPRNPTGVTPYEGAKCRWGGSKSATFD